MGGRGFSPKCLFILGSYDICSVQELYTIIKAINNFSLQRGREQQVHHLLDSQSATVTLKTNDHNLFHFSQVRELIQKAQTENALIEVCWVSMHTNVEGNGNSDTAVKNVEKNVSKRMNDVK